MLKNYCRRKWELIIRLSNNKRWHKFIFPSFWHCLFHKLRETDSHINYLTDNPNAGAGIGDQMSTWHAGYYWSQYFGLNFAHSPFAQASWERFLGYGIGEKSISMLKNEGYRIVRIPKFDEFSSSEIELTKKIIKSYSDQKVVFFPGLNLPYHNQIDVIPVIRRKFYASPSRHSDLTPFDKEHFNIAVHVRRGDITIGQTNGDPNLLMRWLDNEYFEKVLDYILPQIITEKKIHIYIFSQGEYDAFKSFERFPNTHLYLDLNPESTFLSFVYADILITSKSSFSYKPALLNIKGKKVCPRNFWHSYPDDNNWILVDDSGYISDTEIIKINS